MGRHSLETEISIETERAHLWSILVEPKRYKDWFAHISNVTPSTTLKAGARLTITTTFGDHTMVAKVRVVEFEPMRRLKWEDEEAHLDGKPFTHVKNAETEFFLAENGSETRLKVSAGFEPNGLAAKLGANWVLNHKVRPQLEASMQNLKKLAEKEARRKK